MVSQSSPLNSSNKSGAKRSHKVTSVMLVADQVAKEECSKRRIVVRVGNVFSIVISLKTKVHLMHRGDQL